jgi:hypothetical protein
MSFIFGGLQASVTIFGAVTTSNPTASAPLKLVAGQTFKCYASATSGIGAINAGVGKVLYTVTAGKTFYMTSFILVSDGTGRYVISDGGVAGTKKISCAGLTLYGSTNLISFPTPIPFTTDVWIDTQVNGYNPAVSFQGWEE